MHGEEAVVEEEVRVRDENAINKDVGVVGAIKSEVVSIMANAEELGCIGHDLQVGVGEDALHDVMLQP